MLLARAVETGLGRGHERLRARIREIAAADAAPTASAWSKLHLRFPVRRYALVAVPAAAALAIATAGVTGLARSDSDSDYAALRDHALATEKATA